MNNINDLRETLFETIHLLKEGKITKEQALAISSVSQVIVNTAKVEVDFIKETSSNGTGFIENNQPKKLERPPAEYSNNGHLKTIKKYGT